MVSTTGTPAPGGPSAPPQDVQSAHDMLQELCAKRTPPVIASALAFPKKSQPSILIHTAALPESLRPFAQELADALASRGCKPVFHAANASAGADTPLALARAVAETAPHLVLTFNHTRSTLGGAVPDTIPILTWITDLRADHLDVPHRQPLHPLDLIVGNVRPDMVKFHGFPNTRCVYLPIGASTGSFHERPVPDKIRAGAACLVACNSSDADLPEFLHTSRLSMVRSSPEETKLYTDLYPALEKIAMGDDDAGPIIPRVRSLIQTLLLLNKLPADQRAIADVLCSYALPIVHRMMVHHTLESLAKICAANRWTFHLFGRGWSDHPTLGDVAKGDLNTDESLRASYQCARAHLFFPSVCTVPTGMFQCAFSGGLPLMHTWPDNAVASSTLKLDDYLPDPESLTFSSKSTLERALIRARSDDEWRSTLRTKLTARGLSKATPDALAQRVLTLATDHLAVCQLEAAA